MRSFILVHLFRRQLSREAAASRPFFIIEMTFYLMSVASILDLRLVPDLHALTAAVWNLHPAGGLAGEGISPFKRIRSFLTSGSGIGIA